MIDRRQSIIDHILALKNGTHEQPPQPDIARNALEYYVKTYPEMKLNQGVREAMEKNKCVS